MDSSELETAQLFSNYLINELQKAPMGSIGLPWSSIVLSELYQRGSGICHIDFESLKLEFDSKDRVLF